MNQLSLKLFITGTTARAQAAIEGVQKILREHADDWDLNVIDIAESPQEAEEHRILATPTLIRVSPPPVRRVIGDVSDAHTLLRALGLDSQPD